MCRTFRSSTTHYVLNNLKCANLVSFGDTEFQWRRRLIDSVHTLISTFVVFFLVIVIFLQILWLTVESYTQQTLIMALACCFILLVILLVPIRENYKLNVLLLLYFLTLLSTPLLLLWYFLFLKYINVHKECWRLHNRFGVPNLCRWIIHYLTTNFFLFVAAEIWVMDTFSSHLRGFALRYDEHDLF